MQVCRVIAVALAALSISASAGVAKTLRADDGPAEYPPASYSANQYVDSRGCVYVRAGYAGQVTWVPRVNRSRKVLCGFTPSVAKAPAKPKPKSNAVAAAPAVKPVVRSTPAPKPTVVTTSRPAKTKTARAGAPMATIAGSVTSPTTYAPVRSAAVQTPSKPKATGGNWIVRGVENSEKAQKPKPKYTAPVRQVVVQSKPVGQTQKSYAENWVVRSQVAQAAARVDTGANWLVQRAQAAKTARAAGQVTAPAPTVRIRIAAPTATARVQPAPKPQPFFRTAPAMPQPVIRAETFAIPKGYQTAWKDDRLNPMRGRGSASGQARMNLVWTQTVPRVLIDTETGRDVTARYVGLRYPYTNFADQNRYGVSTKSAPAAAAKPKTYTTRASTKSVRSVKPKVAETVVKARAVAPKAKMRAPVKKASVNPAPVRKAASHRFVQVGSFGVPSNAQNTKARLRSLGLPVASSKSTRGGKVLQTIYAGPFKTQAQLNSALGAVRKAGYGDAILRK